MPQNQWMAINTKTGVKIDAARMYPVGFHNRTVIDGEFDKLHRQSKMQWTKGPTKYGYPVFVIWKTVHFLSKTFERKRKIVVDIRGLNKITESDVYFMLLQSDIISAVQNASYITVINCAAFFHQWPVKLFDQNKLTVVSYRGNEQWNVAVMGFKNNLAYVQKQIDGLLRPFKTFARIYIDDVVIFNQSVKKHTGHFEYIFNLFDKMNIVLKFSKSYIGYPTVALLNQKVDNFGLSISIDKLETIRAIKFPRKFKNFETYVGMINYFRNYVLYYV